MLIRARPVPRRIVIAAASAALLAGPATADESAAAIPSVIDFMLEADNVDTRGWQLGALHPFGEQTWLLLTAGRTSSDAGNIDSDNVTFRAAVDHGFEALGVTLGAGYWGDDDALSSVDISASVYWQGEKWRVDGDLEFREVEAKLELTGQGATRRFSRDFSGRGLGLGVSYSPNESLTVFATGRSYDYSDDLDFNPLLTRVLVSLLNLDSALLDNVVGVGVDVELGPGLLTVQLERYESALVDLATDNVAARYAFPITATIDLQLGAGRSDTEILGGSSYGQIGLRWYF